MGHVKHTRKSICQVRNPDQVIRVMYNVQSLYMFNAELQSN